MYIVYARYVSNRIDKTGDDGIGLYDALACSFFSRAKRTDISCIFHGKHCRVMNG